MSLSQQARTPAVSTPLLLRAMKGKERLSTLLKYKLELVSERAHIDPKDLLGQSVTVRLDLPDYRTRCFNGIVSRFSHTGSDGDLAVYQAAPVPWLWLLTQTSGGRASKSSIWATRLHAVSAPGCASS